jgi:hypothetical protein
MRALCQKMIAQSLGFSRPTPYPGRRAWNRRDGQANRGPVGRRSHRLLPHSRASPAGRARIIAAQMEPVGGERDRVA